MSVIYKEPKTRAEIENAADEIAKIRMKIRKLTVARDSAILKISEQYNPQIKELEAERDARELALAPFVSARKEELMGKNKSASSPLSMYGFRTGQTTMPKTNLQPDCNPKTKPLQTTCKGFSFSAMRQIFPTTTHEKNFQKMVKRMAQPLKIGHFAEKSGQTSSTTQIVRNPA